MRSGLSSSGRESQSRAFLSCPGVEWLYSGVEISTASAAATSARRRRTGAGSLALAVLDARERQLQDAMIGGPPPLGPGAPAPARLVAFGAAALDFLAEQADLMLEAELHSGGTWMRSGPYAVRRLHVRILVEQARPGCDVDYVTDVLGGALSAQAFVDQHRVRGLDLDRLKAGYADLVERLVAAG